jgi:drug/metabolite transporter (DMT)-like permease
MPEVLALGSALVFGLVHFLSGLLARGASTYAVALFGQIGGMVLVGCAAVVVPGHPVAVPSLAWGALSGVGTGVGVAFLYRGLSVGNMSVVAPLSDLGSVALPVVAGVALLGDRPSLVAWAGVLAALPALWLVSRPGGLRSPAAVAGAGDGLVAGVGFALQFVAIAQVDVADGLWPILAARVLATATIVPIAVRRRAVLTLPRRLVVPACLVGAAGSAAIVLYLLATQHQLFALATVLAALYPAVPVLLGVLFLHERLAALQVVGLALAGTAIALISLG